MFFLKSSSVTLLFLATIVMAQEDALIHHYKFDGDLKDAVTVDSEDGKVLKGKGSVAIYSEGHDGTANGAIEFFTLATDKYYCVEVGKWSPSELGTKGEMTIAFWTKWKGPSPTESDPKPLPQDIINKRDDYSASKMMWGINQHGFTGHVISVQRDKKVYANSTKGIPKDKWTHVTIVMDGKNAIFYMNGEKYDTQPYTYGSGTTAMIRIGNSANGGKINGNDNYNGMLDDVRFYSRVLTDEEIKAVFSSQVAVTTPLTPRNVATTPLHYNRTTQVMRIDGLSANATILITNLNGKQLVKKQVTSSGIVSVDGLTNGVYLVTLSGTGNVSPMKLVVR